ncbi:MULTISPECIES: hypothetical protein [Marinobacter]|uniref:Uncharacterized protein n=1 Tax=Marinobacter shengliensis TaxID=1389223 RepID=A0ABV4W3D9_9GAMM|nr:hypothetical protein [Marinobacter sp. LQ44]AMQ89738.1 hypothetical protein ASQ50_14095 [Marinobacter sp. LQ44]|tara:strand:+ start:332 stop:676 length:345 start_codon:yes stop_codon:yes gene_type:complete
MTINYSATKNVLKIKPSGIEVPFQWPIAEVVVFDAILVVRIEPDPGAYFNENVFGVREDGSIAWVIEKRKHVYDDSPYTSIVAKDDNVKLFNWDGDELLVEPKSGKVISVGFGK